MNQCFKIANIAQDGDTLNRNKLKIIQQLLPPKDSHRRRSKDQNQPEESIHSSTNEFHHEYRQQTQEKGPLTPQVLEIVGQDAEGDLKLSIFLSC